MSKVEDIIVTVSIDTECDHAPDWARSKPLAFESITEGLPNRLQPVFDQLGAVPSYLLTVEVLEDKQSIEALKSMSGKYELGTHLHAAFIEPQKKFHDYAGVDSPDFQCEYPAEIEYQKLKNLTELFYQKLGYRPACFRAGRYGAAANTIKSLSRLGYKVDSSVTPGIRWKGPKASVDYRRAPMQPYFPIDGSISRASDNRTGLLEVPVTVKPRLIRDPRWFRPWFATVEQMKEIFLYQLRKHKDHRVISINMMFHSMEVIEKASPYPQSSQDVDRFLDDMQQTLQWCADEGASFAGLSGLHDKFSGMSN